MKEYIETAINDQKNGGLQNDDFVKKAHAIYNIFATFPCSLPASGQQYPLGIIFSCLAQYYSGNIDHYTSIMENALFCFSNVMKASESCDERQNAAIRMLLLIDGNDWIMKSITHKFFKRKCNELYGTSLIDQQMIARKLEPWTFETDILKHLGRYCIEESATTSPEQILSVSEIRRFNELKENGKYSIQWPLVNISPARVFDLFCEYIKDTVSTSCERRATQLQYVCP